MMKAPEPPPGMFRPIDKADHHGFREVMIRAVEDLDPGKTAALALSGGIDSATILFAMLASGRRPRCFTFMVEGIESEDMQSSRALARHYGLDLVEAVIPKDLRQVVADCRRIVSRIDVVKTTIVQCVHPWLYLGPLIKAHGHDAILTGLSADDLYGTQRKVDIARRTKGEEWVLNEGWRDLFEKDERFSMANIHRWCLAEGFDERDVYAHPGLAPFMRQFTLADLHKPFQKGLSILAFADYYRQGPFRRERQAYQLGSGLQDLHESILKDPSLNPLGSKAMIAIYNRLKDGRL